MAYNPSPRAPGGVVHFYPTADASVIPALPSTLITSNPSGGWINLGTISKLTSTKSANFQSVTGFAPDTPGAASQIARILLSETEEMSLTVVDAPKYAYRDGWGIANEEDAITKQIKSAGSSVAAGWFLFIDCTLAGEPIAHFVRYGSKILEGEVALFDSEAPQSYTYAINVQRNPLNYAKSTIPGDLIDVTEEDDDDEE